MSLAEIEAELDKLEPHDLRSLALKSWSAFVSKEGSTVGGHLCDENDPEVLAAVDQATDRSDAEPGKGCSGQELRVRLAEWTTR